MSKYELIESVLGGIYGAQIGLSDDEAIAALRKDLEHAPFKLGIENELTEAFADPLVSWRDVLLKQEVSSFDTEQEARDFVREFVYDVVFKAS